jgi:hypothetical protein
MPHKSRIPEGSPSDNLTPIESIGASRMSMGALPPPQTVRDAEKRTPHKARDFVPLNIIQRDSTS